MIAGNFSALLGEAGFIDVLLNVVETGDVLNEIAVPSLQFLGDACEETGESTNSNEKWNLTRCRDE